MTQNNKTIVIIAIILSCICYQSTCSFNCSPQNCGPCDNFEALCIDSGCSYNNLNNKCLATPSYTTNCDVFDGFYKECEETQNCSLKNDGSCETTPDTEDGFFTNCSALNDFEDECIFNPDCSYNSINNTCVSQAGPECSNYLNYGELCETLDHCSYTNNQFVTACGSYSFDPSDDCSQFNGDKKNCLNNDCMPEHDNRSCADFVEYDGDCSVYNEFQINCEETVECTYNVDSDECVARAGLTGGCDTFHNYKQLCNEQQNCAFNSDDFQCVTTPDCATSCDNCNNFIEACNEEDLCTIDYSDNDNCVSVVDTVNQCSDLNGRADQCREQQDCTVDSDFDCVNITTLFTCSSYSGFFDECEAIPVCSFNVSDKSCANTPEYNDNCNIYNNYPNACYLHDGCSFNEQNQTCTSTPNFNNMCNNLNGHQMLCDDQSTCAYQFTTNICLEPVTCSIVADCGNCNGIQNGCTGECSYKISDNTCNETPAFEDECSIFNSYVQLCEQQEGCEVSNTNCVQENTQEPNGEEAFRTALSFSSLVLLILLINVFL